MKKIISQIINVFSILAMAFFFITIISALGLEFFAPPEPKMVWVSIAILLTLFSIFQLSYLKNQST